MGGFRAPAADVEAAKGGEQKPASQPAPKPSRAGYGFRAPAADQKKARETEAPPPPPQKEKGWFERAGEVFMGTDPETQARKKAWAEEQKQDRAVDEGFWDKAEDNLQNVAGWFTGGLDGLAGSVSGSKALQDNANVSRSVTQTPIKGRVSSYRDVNNLSDAANYGTGLLFESAPALALSVANPALGAAVTGGVTGGNVTMDRAANDGRQYANWTDVAVGVPTGLGVGLLEGLGGKGVGSQFTGRVASSPLGRAVTGNAAGRIATSALSEGATEGLQSGLEYTGTTAGTQRGFKFNEFGDQVLEGAVGGSILGGGLRGLGEATGVRLGPQPRIDGGVSVDPLIDAPFEAGPANGRMVDPTSLSGQARERIDLFDQRYLPFMNAPDSNPEAVAELTTRRSQLVSDLQAAENIDRQQLRMEANDPAPRRQPTRVIPDDVPIIGTPDGLLRSDDTGGMAGYLRSKAADQNVIQRAQARAGNDPTLAYILGSGASPQTMNGPLWSRLAQVDASGQREQYPLPPLNDVQLPEFQPGKPAVLPKVEGGKVQGNVKGPAAVSNQAVKAAIRIPESGGNDRAKNPLGSASGRYQFIESTWVGLYAQTYGVSRKAAQAKWNDGNSRFDAGIQENLMDTALNGYRSDLKRAGLPETAGNMYMLHFLGNRSGVRLLQADPNENIIDALYRIDPKNAASIVKSNPGYIKKGNTVGQTLNLVRGKVDGKGVDYGDAQLRQSAPDAPEPAPYRVADEYAPQRYDQQTEMDVGRRLDRGYENTVAPESPTLRERERGTNYEAPMGTGDSSKAFKAANDDPQGQPDFWETRARMKADDLRSAWEADQAEKAASAGPRMENERKAGDDPADRWKKYAQKPAQKDGVWSFTDDGFVAGDNGNPVAFRSAREAAKWAAANKMGGDVQPAVWKTNSQRVVLQKREGSTYGETPPTADAPEATAPRAAPNFERTPPPAGRSTDRSQRLIGGEQVDTPDTAPRSTPETPVKPVRTAPYRAPEGQSASSGIPREKVVTASGREIETEFEVVEARDLITSDMPGFDQRFQPRDRGSRAASDAQIADIASKLDPEQLAGNRLASQGAPIVGKDRMVESGNGRTAAIRRAYAQHPERAAEYRSMIEKRGFDTSGMDEPVLVRKRVTELDDNAREAFTREAQASGVMKMSGAEQAAADAKAVNSDVTGLYRGGDLNSAGNRDFVRAFMDKVVDAEARNDMMMTDGSLSGDGLKRIERAMMQRAYDDMKFVEKLALDPDTDIKSIGNVLRDVAPAFVQLKDRIAAGELPAAFDITPQIVEISKLVSRTRTEKRPMSDFLDQTDIFAGDVDPITEALASIMLKGEGLTKARSARDMEDGLRFYINDVERSGADLFGGDLTDRARDIAQAAAEMLRQRDVARGEQPGNLFDRPAFAGSGAPNADRIRALPNELRAVTGEYAELAGKLADIVGDDATVRYGGAGMTDVRGRRGEADVETGRAYVVDASDTEALLHEAVHVAVMGRYGEAFDNLRAGDFAKSDAEDLIRLFYDARDRARGSKFFGQDVRYALSTPDEFIAMALTNKATQRWLDRGSLFDRFIDGARKILGLEPRMKSMLGDVMRAGSGVLDAAARDPLRRSASARPAMPRKKGLVDSVIDRDGLSRDAARVKAAVGNPLATAKKLFSGGDSIVGAALYSNDARMRGLAKKFDSEALEELADIFHAQAGKDKSTGRTYHEAVSHYASTQMSKAFKAIEDFADDTAALARVRELLTDPAKRVRATGKERDAATTIRDVLKEIVEYRKDAGEDIGEVTTGYFPRVLDVEKAVSQRDKFLDKAEQLYRRHGAANPKAAAEAWFNRVFDEYAGVDGGLDFLGNRGSPGGARSSKSREFGADADKLLADFFSDDVVGTLAGYIMGSARRAEYTRRFGVPGREGSKARADWQAKHGDKTQREVLEDRIKADMRASDQDAGDTFDLVNKIVMSNLGQLGAGVGAKTRLSISYLHAWNQVAKLDRTVVTSLTELAMGFVRGGPRYGMQFVGNSLYEFGRKIAKADPSDAARWADALGITQDAMVNEMLLSRAGADLSSNRVQRLMANFFKGIGLHQYTEGTRTAAVKMGRAWIDTVAGDMNSKSPRVRNRAELYLKELGVKDTAGFAAWVRSGAGTLDAVKGDKGGFASDYVTALMRFTDQTIIMPDRATKPTMANHPVGSLFYSLMSWSYGFKKNVLDRAGRLGVRAFKDKDPALLLPALGLAVLAVWADFVDSEIRPTLFGSKYDFDSETPTEHAMRVADRAGFTGAMSPLVNAVRGIKYDRSLGDSVSGPILGTMFDTGEKLIVPFTEGNSPNTNTAERNAARAIYDAFIEPALDATAAGRLKGAARTAGILSTGNAEGGVLPADRDWFVDTVAGEKAQ